MSKKTVAIKGRLCKKCNNGYYICIYHEKHTNSFTKIGSNCECEKSTIDHEWVTELYKEYNGEIITTASLF